MTPITISDPDDPRVAAYTQMRERDLVGRAGRFVVEGDVVLRLALRRSRFPLESILLAERRLPALRADLPGDLPVYVAPQEVLDRVTGFSIHRGVLAIGRREGEPSAEALLGALPPRALVVALLGLTNHDNVGGIFRNCAAFGADAVLLDPATCDPLYRKAIRVSAGACLIVPFARAPDAGAMLTLLDREGFETLALSPRGERILSGVPRRPRAALLLGTEGPGLPEAVLARTRTVRIPMSGGFDSLNVATTSGIALHHLAG